MKKIAFLWFCMGLATFWAQAQDVHFSQFYAYPAYNPANTGNFNGNYRVGGIARNQWSSVTVPYQTLGVYGDLALFQDESGRDNWLGVGGQFLYDRAGDGVLQTLQVGGSVAMHKDLSRNVYVSLGGGFTYTRKGIDFDKLYFNSQWNENDFDENIGNGENFEYNRRGYLDLSAGGSVTASLTEDFTLNAAFSALHVNEPVESFYFTTNTSGNNRRGVRPIASISAAYKMGNISWQPAVFLSREKKAQEIIGGLNVVYTLTEGSAYNPASKIHGGLWYRSAEAIIVVAGYEWSKYRALLSYDINVSELKAGSNYRGGPELSFVHIGGFRQRSERLYCPRF
ncbi:MAG: PorP/SprF family type IX secretion system membrane protein [Sphingobacteriales bacterium]|nr:PorP/SprF family type IX secretion system membrane protein [Sphingobacteriales bacterium]